MGNIARTMMRNTWGRVPDGVQKRVWRSDEERARTHGRAWGILPVTYIVVALPLDDRGVCAVATECLAILCRAGTSLFPFHHALHLELRRFGIDGVRLSDLVSGRTSFVASLAIVAPVESFDSSSSKCSGARDT